MVLKEEGRFVWNGVDKEGRRVCIGWKGEGREGLHGVVWMGRVGEFVWSGVDEEGRSRSKEWYGVL